MRIQCTGEYERAETINVRTTIKEIKGDIETVRKKNKQTGFRDTNNVAHSLCQMTGPGSTSLSAFCTGLQFNSLKKLDNNLNTLTYNRLLKASYSGCHLKTEEVDKETPSIRPTLCPVLSAGWFQEYSWIPGIRNTPPHYPLHTSYQDSKSSLRSFEGLSFPNGALG